MRSLTRLAAIVAAAALSCVSTSAQTLVKDSALPLASTLTGVEGMRTTQGSGCATSVSPCANVRVTPAQIATYLGPTFQASDADLAAIAALAASPTTRATTPFGLNLLTQADAPTTRTALGLGSNATDSTARVPTSLAISTAAPLAGGGTLTGNLSLSIAAASSSAAGTMSASDKAKLDGIAAGATANTGTVTTISAAGANGIIVSVANAGTTPAITISGSALTPSTVAASGAVTGSNLSGTNTGDQTSVTGNAGTATKLATARKVNGIPFDGSIDITVNAVDSTARLAAGNNLFDVASPSAALANLAGAPLASPALTGTPTAPTAAVGTATTQVATTGFADTLKDMPQNSLSASYTLVLSDRGKHLYYGSNSGNTITIPASASVAFPIGTRILIVNIGGGTQTVAPASNVQLYGSGGYKSYGLPSGNAATIIKIGTDLWFIFGTSLS